MCAKLCVSSLCFFFSTGFVCNGFQEFGKVNKERELTESLTHL